MPHQLEELPVVETLIDVDAVLNELEQHSQQLDEALEALVKAPTTLNARTAKLRCKQIVKRLEQRVAKLLLEDIV